MAGDSQNNGTPESRGFTHADRKERDILLWTEMRSLRETLMRTLQWSVTALAAVHLALFNMRREMAERMFKAKELLEGQPLPFGRYIIGTFYLTVIATLFALILNLILKRTRHTRKQLEQSNFFQIEFEKPKWYGRWIIFGIIYAFPLLDLVVRLYVRVSLDLGIK